VAAERRRWVRLAANASVVALALTSGGFAPGVPRARPEPDWSALGREVAEETNRLRSDPASYASYLEAMLSRFDGSVLERPGRPFLRTEEGAPAVQEAIAALRAARPVQPLHWSSGLARAAADHVRDQGPVGGTEHSGTDGSDPARRMERYGQWRGAVAENIAYGENPARDVVLQLVVDDGVPNRGHRDALLEASWGISGVACGRHRDYGQICVMDYAMGYEER
jgi:uncharacterized protein YkwD